MATPNLGYREWKGELAPAATRWAVISQAAILAAWKSRWIRRLLFLACVPAFWYGMLVFGLEQSVQSPNWKQWLLPVLAWLDRAGYLHFDPRSFNPTDMRHSIWSLLLQSYFRYPQSIVMVLIVGLIAPPMISQDVRSRAFLLYFSRPLDRVDYLLGKSAAVWTYVALISAFPAMLLYLMGVLLSSQVDVLMMSWDLPLRILLASAILVIPTTSLALMFSSLTQESRYAAFAWFSVWIFGWLAYSVMQTVELATGVAQAAKRGQDLELSSSWSLLSLFHILGEVQSWAFGFAKFQDVLTPALILVVITVVAQIVLYRRISAPLRA